MYNMKDLKKQCTMHGFSLLGRNTLSRCIGDGVLQQIYYGEPNKIWIGLTSMYSDLPDIFWKSKVPFTTYRPQNLHGIPATYPDTRPIQDDISLLIDGGLTILDEIDTQDKLLQFAFKTNSIQEESIHRHNDRFWGAYIMCGLKDELMHEVCHAYVDICEAFRRKKENLSLIEKHDSEKFFDSYLVLHNKLTKLSTLWGALLVDDIALLMKFARTNLNRNLEQAREKNITIMER